MTIINKRLPVVCPDKKCPKFPFRFRWTHLSIFQLPVVLFCVLFVIHSPAWAGISNLSVDANGDSVFNGDNEKLTITFTTSDFGDDDQKYTYIIKTESNGNEIIIAESDTTIERNQTVRLIWDGAVEVTDINGNSIRQALPDGVYTITVELTDESDNQSDDDSTQVASTLTDDITATLDKTKPTIEDVSVGKSELSSNLGTDSETVPVSYTLSEDVKEAWLEILRSSDSEPIGRRIQLKGVTKAVKHTFEWDGKDGNNRNLENGSYRLKLSAIDYGGNADEIITEQITIDSEQPRITGITINDSIPLINGSFVNTSIQTIGFTADAGSGTPLDFNTSKIQIRPINGTDLSGALTVTGNNKAEFTLGNPLDNLSENGNYEVTVFILNSIGNRASSTVNFTFDNTAPTLISLKTNREEFTQGSGLSGSTNYLEAELEDNIELDLPASSIRLKGPDGSLVLGEQTQISNNKMRWQLRSPLLATDGIQDGHYTVEIIGADKANNRTEPINITFIYDNLAPELVSLQPTRDGTAFDILGDTTYYNLPLNQFVATFNDGESGIGVLFSGSQDTTSIVFGTPKPDGSIDAISGRTFVDKNNSVLSYILDSPLLSTDGSQDGNYVISIKAADALGNFNTINYRLIYDTQVPTLTSTVPAVNQTVSSLTEVVIKLNEEMSGIDFVQSNYRLTRDIGENQVEVPVNISSNGTDTVTLTLLQQIALDGSDDGTYTIEVTPADNAGNVGAPIRRPFYLVSTTQPRIRLTTPETNTVRNITQISAVIENYIGIGIDFNNSYISVNDADGTLIPATKVEYDIASNQLTWTNESAIPRDGTADGGYAISVSFFEFNGEVYTETFPLTLDTEYPSIATVETVTDPLRSLSIDSAMDVNETFSQINVTFAENDVDFENTVVSLVGPDSTEIALHRSTDGDSVLTLNFQNLSNLGTYTLSVTPTDRIGNVSQHPYVYKFDLEIAVPVVTTILIGGQSGAIVYVNDSVGEIVATLLDTTGTGLAVGDSESRIVVTSQTGLPVPGTTTINDRDQQNWQLIWRPIVLPTDGSGDGTYTVAVTPVDNAGRTGNVALRGFIYDTQEPRVTSASPVTLHQPVSYLGGSFPQLQFTIEDVGPASLELDAQTISLTNSAGETVSGQITHDGVNQLFYTLSAPLPTDGSADGEYLVTVNLLDRASNPHQFQHNIFYDSQAPLISTVSLNTDTPLDLIPYQVIDLDESVSRITVDFVESTRVNFENTVVSLIGPDGSDIPFNLENDGVNQLTASFVSLIQDGLYTLSIISQDITGNSARGEVPYPFRLEFEVPRLSAVKVNTSDTAVDLIPHQIVEISDVINQVTLAFTDPTRLDFENTSVELLAPDGQQISLTQEAFIQEEGGLSQLSVRFISMTENGLYTLRVTPQDIAGNIAQTAAEYQFRLDIALPSVSSVLIDGQLISNLYVNKAISTIVATFIEPSGIGLDFSDDGSSITVTNESGIEVVGITQSNEQNQLTWMPLAFPADGSIDGIYNVSVTPIDRVGRTGKVVNRQFSYDTQAPRIIAASPIELHQPTTYVGGSLTQFQISIEDVGPALLDLDAQKITLHRSDGDDVSGVLTHDNSNQLYFTLSTPLPTDGSADGEYGLTVSLVDSAGNSDQTEYKVYYDSQAPSISSLTLNTETPLNLTPYKVTELTETVSKLTLRFVDSTRVDFANTNVMLTAPNGTEIPLTITNNGVDELTANFVTLTQGGEYTLSVTPQDIAGNVAKGAVLYPFRLDYQLPELTSVKAGTTNQTVPLTPYEIVEVTEAVSSFILEFTDVMLIDIENTSVTLSGPDGEAVVVTLEEGDGSQLVARFVPLEQSGMYSLSITPQDTLGQVVQSSTTYQFRLDFEVPKVTSVSAKTADATIVLTPFEIIEITEVVNSIGIGFSDMMRVDIENTNVTLLGPDGETVVVTLEEGDGSQLVARFVPLEQSGMYSLSITPQDTLGHIAQSATTYQFRLDLQVPTITSVNANTTDAAIALTPYEIIDITGTVNSIAIGFSDVKRIDIEDTDVTLSGPDGEALVVTLEAGDGSEIVARFVSLTRSGMYSLSITPQDRLGNVAQSATTYQFRLDLQVPAIISVNAKTTDAAIALTPFEITDITETFNSIGIGFSDVKRIDIEDTNVTLSGPDGEGIVVSLEEGYGSEIVARFVSLTRSGMYSLSITPQDTLGNVAQSATIYQFRLDLQVPRITSVNAKTTDATIALTPFEIVDITETVNSIGIGFTDVKRIDIENTNVTLSGPDGEAIVVMLEEGDSSQLVVRFVPLVQSGMYRLSITPQDTLGQVAQSSVTYQFRLDLQVPEIISVNANVADTHVALTPYEEPIISNSFSSFTLEFTDAENLDDENTLISLSGPNGQEVAVTLEKGDDSKYVVRFVALTENGLYTISVTPQDKAGNVGQSAYQYQFRLDIALPTVQSISIDGKLGSTIYVSNSTPRIIASLTDALGVGLSFGENGSTIVVTDSRGLQIPGTTTSNDSNQLIWIPIPFATDGSADGQYNVAVTPIDMNGRSGTVVNRNFIYDSQAPRITAASPITLHAPVSYIGSGLSEFILTIEDEGPAGFVLLSQVAALMDASDKLVPATITHDDLTDQLYLTLSTPFANDGSADGTYTLNVALIDKAGNRKTSQYAVVYDSRIPQISSVQVNTAGTAKDLVANEVTELSESISTITLSFSEATRVDFANTAVSLLDPSDLSVPLTIEDDGVSELTIRFPNLTEIGQYILSVTPQDIAGNTATSPIEYTFDLEFILPTVESIQIGDTITLGSGDIAYVNADNLVIVANLLDPAGTGLSFDPLTGSDITVTTLDGIIVFGSTGTNNSDVIAWEPITLSTDGSSDGRYAVYVTPVDKEGREGSTIYREFILDTQEPEITSASPVNLSQPVSYVSESLTQLQFAVQDVGPAGLLLEDQQISLRNQSGAVIPTKLTNDSQDQLYLTLNEPLPLDGSMDGEYTVVIAFTDKAGNMLSVEHPIIYDTQAPTLVSTVPVNGELLTEDLTQIVVNLSDEGESGIDWSNTTVTLIDPNGVEISGDVSSNGRTQLTLNTNQLVADGRYTIRVQAIDRAGNGNLSVFESSFLLSRLLPAVISTVPITAPEDEAYINEAIEQIEVMLQTEDARHLSTVRLLNADGQVVDGQQHRETDKLIYQLVRPLATDGSEDGVYTIEFTPISASGRSGEVQSMTFTYDTQGPELITDDIQLIVVEPEVNNSLVEIRVPITDIQAGIDWEELDDAWFAFDQLTPNRDEITGRLSYDAEQSILIFRLNVPLADNGSADGEYRITITPIDKAGNGDETYEKELTYDTSPPVIDPSTLLINDAPLLTDIDAEDYPSSISTSGGVVIQASITDVGLGVNLSQSSITIINPNGQEISGTSQQNGIDTIVFKSDGLNIEGIYQVTVTGTGNDSELLGFSPKASITVAFLYETTQPTGSVINDGGKTEFTDEAIPFEGTAVDPEGSRRAGQQGENEVPVPASGVLLVEIVGTGPDGQEIEPVPAEDDSNAQAQPWSSWSVDFLPTRSGEYDLDLRVTDKAGNYTVYDIGEYTMSVSFSFKGNTFGWPNPLRKSKNDVAFFSFDLNAPEDEALDMTLYIYDWGGDLVYKQKYANITTGQRDDSRIKWNLENRAGNSVARGIYVFRLEAVNGAGNRANAVGKVLVVD